MGGDRQPEIHLLFEGIHFGDLHLDFIAEPNDPPRAAANQVVALGIENVKIIGHGGKRDQAAHGQPGDIHEETEIAGISDQSGVALRMT